MLNGEQLDARKFPPTTFDAEKASAMQILLNTVPVSNGSDSLEWMMMEKITSKIHPNHAIDYERLLECKKTAEKYLTYYQRYSVIISTVSNLSGVTEHEIKAHYRKLSVKDARHVTIFCIRWTTKYSLNEISKLISPEGAKVFHHSTLINACKSVVNGIKIKDKELYLLLIKTIFKLRDEGIEIDLKKEQPAWFIDLYNDDEKENLLVAG